LKLLRCFSLTKNRKIIAISLQTYYDIISYMLYIQIIGISFYFYQIWIIFSGSVKLKKFALDPII